MARALSSVATEAVAIAIHDLAQPLSAAALSIETASLLLAREEREASQERITAALRGLELSNRLVRVMKLATGGEPSPWTSDFPPDEALHTVWPALRLPTLRPIHGDRNFLEAALTGLSMVFCPEPSGVTLVVDPDGRGCRIRLPGKTRHAAMTGFWLRVIRKAGVRASAYARGDGVAVILGLGPGVGAAAAKPVGEETGLPPRWAVDA
jgi:hypothetical protein